MTLKAFVARDENGELWIFFHGKPHRHYNIWYSDPQKCPFAELSSKGFPSVKWEDDEPTEVEVTIKPKKR